MSAVSTAAATGPVTARQPRHTGTPKTKTMFNKSSTRYQMCRLAKAARQSQRRGGRSTAVTWRATAEPGPKNASSKRAPKNPSDWGNDYDKIREELMVSPRSNCLSSCRLRVSVVCRSLCACRVVTRPSAELWWQSLSCHVTRDQVYGESLVSRVW